MENCNSNHHLLPESYIVQPVENIPLSVIEYDKIEMTELIDSRQLTTTTPIIQLTDFNSNLKTKMLHPLELEIQKDIELKKQQQEVLAKHSITSVIQYTPQLEQDVCINKTSKVFETTSPLFDGVVQLQEIPNRKETVVNVNTTKNPENIFCHIPQFNGPLGAEKRQFIIVSDQSMLFDLVPKENKFIESKQTTENVISSELFSKPEMENASLLLENSDKNKVHCEKAEIDSDSENEENAIEPVGDYDPDPDVTTKINLEQAEKPNKCYMCFRSFRHKKNMYAHIRQIHSVQPKIEGGILCPLCKMHALRQEHLRNHLETLHEISIEKEERLFNTMEEFLSWKELTERETLSLFVSKSSSKLLANNQQKTYYKCHRSGSYTTHKKENRKKKLKVQGSNKIGATCPAAMEVTENVNGINVIYWKTHVGHENDLAHLVLSKEDKAKIMDYIISGTSWDKILEKIKKDELKCSNTPSKLTIISKQDLRNIKKVHDMKSTSDLFSTKKRSIQSRKPMKEILRRASQSLIIEKLHVLLKLLETTDVRPEFRPKICLMIDNLISTVKRRIVKLPKGQNQKRKSLIKSQYVEDELDEKLGKSETNSNNELHLEDSVYSIFDKTPRKTNSIKSESMKHSPLREGKKVQNI